MQRRENGGDFARVGEFLYAQGGPLSGASYTWTDTGIDGGPFVYRLEAVDFDQSVEFFAPTRIENDTAPSNGHVIYLPVTAR
ncbi:MAG: hypothetical protein R2873_21535 [Caldilineaceae bacterium]